MSWEDIFAAPHPPLPYPFTLRKKRVKIFFFFDDGSTWDSPFRAGCDVTQTPLLFFPPVELNIPTHPELYTSPLLASSSLPPPYPPKGCTSTQACHAGREGDRVEGVQRCTWKQLDIDPHLGLFLRKPLDKCSLTLAHSSY